MRAESMQKVFEMSRTLKHPIDRYHYDLMDSITATKWKHCGQAAAVSQGVKVDRRYGRTRAEFTTCWGMEWRSRFCAIM
jgi:hypothetical protein